MKTAIALFTLALGASIPMQGAAAADRGQPAPLAASSHDEDFSAKRKRQRVHVYGPSYGYYGSPYYRPGYRAYAADPSWQSPELRRLRALNRCVVDLGYGRWENCD